MQYHAVPCSNITIVMLHQEWVFDIQKSSEYRRIADKPGEYRIDFIFAKNDPVAFFTHTEKLTLRTGLPAQLEVNDQFWRLLLWLLHCTACCIDYCADSQCD